MSNSIYFFSKGQALQFNWLFEKGAIVLHDDETFSINFDKVLLVQISNSSRSFLDSTS